MPFTCLGIGLVIGIVTGLCVNLQITLVLSEKDSKNVRRLLIMCVVLIFLILVLDFSQMYYAGAGVP